MKDKILLFAIGVLVGAVITTGAFYVYSTLNNSNNCTNEFTQRNGGQRPSMNGNEPPEMPNNIQQNKETES